ncbi:MAG: hypothetical protein ABR593_04720 [Candidatus Limnocylindria bacterium]
MTKRIVAVGLWAYFGWYLAAHVTALLGSPASLAPLGGVLMVVIALYDWRRLAYGRQGRVRPVSFS